MLYPVSVVLLVGPLFAAKKHDGDTESTEDALDQNQFQRVK
jgi:hypothetical protein